MQRGYDQIIHDIALQKLPAIFCMDRAGLVGNDGPTHHGVFDISFMKSTGAKNIWNIYGSTECIPPVMISNDATFNLKESPYYLEYDKTLWVNGIDTGDKFEHDRCVGRQIANETWKT